LIIGLLLKSHIRSVIIHHFGTLKKEALVSISVSRLCCGVVMDYRKVTGAETGAS